MNTADILCYESKKGNFSLDDKLQTVLPTVGMTCPQIQVQRDTRGT